MQAGECMVERIIVIIDDELGILATLGELLEDEGFSVRCLSRPDQLRTATAGIDPDLFLIDMMMPGASGIEVAEELRAVHFSETPMIAMSASLLMVRIAEECGLFREAISKPFDLDDVLEAVERQIA